VDAGTKPQRASIWANARAVLLWGDFLSK